jgi:predicted ABC-type ATPase
MIDLLDRRPIVVALAGPNGAGKSTFYRAFLANSGLRFVNADQLTQQLNLAPYRAAELAAEVRRELIARRESFIFETVLSDPVGDKIAFLKAAEIAGYTVVLFFIGIPGPEVSNQRVAMRVSKGGHDVPPEKLRERYPRVMKNLKQALLELKNVQVYDNSDLKRPYTLVAAIRGGREIRLYKPTPKWLRDLLP